MILNYLFFREIDLKKYLRGLETFLGFLVWLCFRRLVFGLDEFVLLLFNGKRYDVGVISSHPGWFLLLWILRSSSDPKDLLQCLHFITSLPYFWIVVGVNGAGIFQKNLKIGGFFSWKKCPLQRSVNVQLNYSEFRSLWL